MDSPRLGRISLGVELSKGAPDFSRGDGSATGLDVWMPEV
jgi:hypothetical protein